MFLGAALGVSRLFLRLRAYLPKKLIGPYQRTPRMELLQRFFILVDIMLQSTSSFLHLYSRL